MSESLLVKACMGAFVLGFFGILSMLGARFLADLQSATIWMGIGPKLFVIDLNRFRYQINLVPLFMCEVERGWHVRRTQSKRMDLLGMVGLLLLAIVLIYASFLATKPPSFEETSSGPGQETREQANLPIIESVLPGTPATKAGLEPGMAIRSMNGRRIRTGVEPVVPIDGQKDAIELEVFSQGELSTPVKTVLKAEDKNQGLGFAYTIRPEFRDTTQSHFVIYDLTRDAFWEAGVLSRFSPRLLPYPIESQSSSFLKSSLLIHAASVALFFACLALLRAFFYDAFLLWSLALLYVMQVSWLGISILALLLALFYLWKELKVVIALISWGWFFFFPPAPIYYGFYVGILSGIAQLKHIDMTWTL